MGKIGEILSRVFSTPVWDWIQVEVTTRCNASCLYCPRTVYGKRWPNRDLPLEAFQRLLRDLPRCRYVHLQGWGEPFLHPDLFRMVKMAKDAGCRIGTTTNGTLLNPELSKRIVEAKFDVVAFSIAGTGAKNDEIRRGAPVAKVMEGIRNLSLARGNSPCPEIHIAYMLMASSLDEILGLPELLQGVKISQVVISTLDFVPKRELEKEIVDGEEKEILELLEEVSSKLEKKGVQLHHLLGPSAGRIWPCTENVLKAAVIGSDGQVSPCVYTNMDVPLATQWRDGRERPIQRVSFGSVNDRPLLSIWNDPDYRTFRDSFSSGPLKWFCSECPKLNPNEEKQGRRIK